MVGRKDERARLKALLDAAREGRSGALLLHGPPGIGKTELLRYAVEAADGFRLLRARGMESESDIPYAGLAELVSPLLSHLEEIPEVQASALRGALALGPATALPRPGGSSPLRSCTSSVRHVPIPTTETSGPPAPRFLSSIYAMMAAPSRAAPSCSSAGVAVAKETRRVLGGASPA